MNENKVYYIIYKTTHITTKKFYIGKHVTTDINDSYLGSGLFLKRAIKKYGRQDFYKEILFIFDTKEEMNQKERELVTEEFCQREDTYNFAIGGQGGDLGEYANSKKRGKKVLSEKAIEAARKRRGQKRSPEARKHMSDARQNNERCLRAAKENLKKAVEACKNRTYTVEQRKAISERLKGHPVSQKVVDMMKARAIKIDLDFVRNLIKDNPKIMQKDILKILNICDNTLRKAIKPLTWKQFVLEILSKQSIDTNLES